MALWIGVSSGWKGRRAWLLLGILIIPISAESCNSLFSPGHSVSSVPILVWYLLAFTAFGRSLVLAQVMIMAIAWTATVNRGARVDPEKASR